VEHSPQAFHVEHRLRELADRYGLNGEAVDALRTLLAHQAADEHASTTVRSADEAVDRHVADSLVALDLPAVREATRLADLGAGAGWPGLALAAALPDTRVALVESAARRCRYLERAVDAAGLANVDVVHARAEEWIPPATRDAGEGMRDAVAAPQDVITARALAPLAVVCEYAAPLLREGGTLVAWKGRLDEAEAADGAAAAAVLGLATPEAMCVDPYPGAGPATLVVARKIAPTPDRFPRRPGIARKRPLGRDG
jgi:16S rRNA (guanine527-N7)-methyltransferase